MPETDLSLTTVFILGVSLGLTACAVTCLPFIGTWAFGRAGDDRERIAHTALFLAGRLCAYTALGGLAALCGVWFVRGLAEGVGNLVIGLAGLHAAVWLAWPGATRQGCAAGRHAAGLSPFLMGVSLTLIPCAPLATLLASAAAAQDPWQGALLGGVFGAGALCTPMLLLIPAASTLGARLIREQAWLQTWLRFGAASVLGLVSATRLAHVDRTLAPPLVLVALLGVALGWLRDRRRRMAYASNTVTRRSVPLHYVSRPPTL